MSKLDQLAESLFVKFKLDFPLVDKSGAIKSIKNLPKKNIEQRLALFYQEARQLRKMNRLWVVGWARVIMKLQQRLLLEGYPSEVVSKLLMAMIFTANQAD